MRITRGLAGLLAIGLVFLAVVSPSWQGVAEAATLNVNTDQDTTDGVCATTPNGCSLRDAIAAAASGDRINIPAGISPITLGSQLTIAKDLALVGAGQSQTIIQAATTAGTADYRVLNITSGDVHIHGVTIRYGKVDNQSTGGGGILN